MNILLKILFSLSLSGSLLILLLFLCKPLYKNILTKKWQYYIWVIVIARLLVPFAPELNLVGTFFQSFDTMKQNTTNISDFNYNYTTTNTEFIIEEELTNMVQDKDTPVILPSISSSPLSIQMIFSFLIEYLFFIWFVTALILLIRKITIYQGFLSYIKASRVEVSDISLLNRFSELQDISLVRRRIELYTNELISSPLLIGFIHPCIILPTTDIPSADFDYTILHELTHYKQMDLFYKWLIQLTVCIHWFNPLVYLMAREINRVCELSCDEAVIQDLDDDGIQAYGDTLLHTVKIKGTYKSCVASVTLTESKELLMERLAALMDFKKPTRQASIIAILCTVFISFSSIVAGAYPISTNSKTTVALNSKTYATSADNTIAYGTRTEISYENAAEHPSEDISIIEYSDTLSENLDALLPYMSSDTLEKTVIIYLDQYYNTMSNSDKKVIANTISKAFPYMKQDAIENLAYFIINEYGIWDEILDSLLPYMNSDILEEIVIIYLDQYNTSNSNIKFAMADISKAFPYMKQDAIENLAYFIIDNYIVWADYSTWNEIINYISNAYPYMSKDAIQRLVSRLSQY